MNLPDSHESLPIYAVRVSDRPRHLDHAEVAEDLRDEGDRRVPETARLATLPKLAFTWSGVLMSSTPIIAGIVVTQKMPTAGYPMGIIGLFIGLVIGASTVGWLSTWGPRTGLGQMPLNRLAFGRGNVLPEIILVFSLILWSTFNLVFGVTAILEVLHLPFALGMLIVGGTQLIVGLLGYRAFQRLGLIVTILMSLVIVALAIGASQEMPPMSMFEIHGDMTFDGLALGVAFGMGSTFSWNIQATDTSRNLPANTPPRRVFWTVWFSMVLPIGILAFLGAWIGTMAAVDAPMRRIDEVLGGGAIATIALLTLGLGLAAENSYNDFSNVIIIRSWGLRWNRRVVSVICTLAAVGLAALLHNSTLSDLSENGGIVLGYFCAPVFGVVGVELFRRRRQREPWNTPPATPRSAVAAFAIAFVALFTFTQTPFGDTLSMNVPGLEWVGAAPRLILHGVEGGYFAGLILAAVLYIVFGHFERRRHQPSS